MGIVRKQALQSTIYSYLGAGIGFFNKIVLFTLVLDTAQIGLVNVMLNVAAMFAQLSSLGFVQVTLKYFPYFRSKKEGHRGILFWTLLYPLIGFFLFGLVFILFRPWLSDYWAEKAPLLVEYYFYIIPLGLSILYFNILDTYLRSLYKTVVPIFLREVGHKLVMTFAVSLYAFGWVDFQTFTVLFILMYSGVTLVMVAYIAYLRQLFIRPRKSPTWKKYQRGILIFGFFSLMANVSSVALANIDSLMLAGNLNPGNGGEDVGVYTTLHFLTLLILIPWRALMKITSPLVAEHWKKKEIGKLNELYKQTSLINLIIGCFLFLGLWVNRSSLFAFLSDEFLTGEYVLLFIGLARVFELLTGLNGVILVTSERYRYDFFFNVVLIGMTVGTNLYFIPQYGLSGAAFATMISYVAFNLLRLIAVWVFFRLHPFTVGMIPVLLITATAVGVNYLIPFLGNQWLDLALRSLSLAVIFGGSTLALRISPDLNNFTSRAWNRLMKRIR